MDQIAHRLRSRLEVDTEFGSFLGDTRIRLLEAIDTHGSISQAAKAVPLSYKAAWDAVDAMNNLADEAAGGAQRPAASHGGGTLLTELRTQDRSPSTGPLEAEYQGGPGPPRRPA